MAHYTVSYMFYFVVLVTSVVRHQLSHMYVCTCGSAIFLPQTDVTYMRHIYISSKNLGLWWMFLPADRGSERVNELVSHNKINNEQFDCHHYFGISTTHFSL